MSDRLRGLLPKALDILEEALKGDNVKAAVEVLKATGMYGLQKPEGSVDPADIEAGEAEAEAARESRSLMASILSGCR
jgi:hypothetical protein